MGFFYAVIDQSPLEICMVCSIQHFPSIMINMTCHFTHIYDFIENSKLYYHLSFSSGIPRNASSVSLSDQERAGTPFGVAPKAILLQRRPHTGEAEFLGLTLPVDINMMFEVNYQKLTKY